MIRLELEIEELVVQGLEPRQVDALVAALRSELAAGLAAEPLRRRLVEGGNVELASPAPIHHKGLAEPAELGRAAARSVTRELSR